MIEMKPVQSRMIDAVGYDPEKEAIMVSFLKGKATWEYWPWPKETYDKLRTAQSVGIFFIEHIKHQSQHARKKEE